MDNNNSFVTEGLPADEAKKSCNTSALGTSKDQYIKMQRSKFGRLAIIVKRKHSLTIGPRQMQQQQLSQQQQRLHTPHQQSEKQPWKDVGQRQPRLLQEPLQDKKQRKRSPYQFTEIDEMIQTYLNTRHGDATGSQLPKEQVNSQPFESSNRDNGLFSSTYYAPFSDQSEITGGSEGFQMQNEKKGLESSSALMIAPSYSIQLDRKKDSSYLRCSSLQQQQQLQLWQNQQQKLNEVQNKTQFGFDLQNYQSSSQEVTTPIGMKRSKYFVLNESDWQASTKQHSPTPSYTQATITSNNKSSQAIRKATKMRPLTATADQENPVFSSRMLQNSPLAGEKGTPFSGSTHYSSKPQLRYNLFMKKPPSATTTASLPLSTSNGMQSQPTSINSVQAGAGCTPVTTITTTVTNAGIPSVPGAAAIATEVGYDFHQFQPLQKQLSLPKPQSLPASVKSRCLSTDKENNRPNPFRFKAHPPVPLALPVEQQQQQQQTVKRINSKVCSSIVQECESLLERIQKKEGNGGAPSSSGLAMSQSFNSTPIRGTYFNDLHATGAGRPQLKDIHNGSLNYSTAASRLVSQIGINSAATTTAVTTIGQTLGVLSSTRENIDELQRIANDMLMKNIERKSERSSETGHRNRFDSNRNCRTASNTSEPSNHRQQMKNSIVSTKFPESCTTETGDDKEGVEQQKCKKDEQINSNKKLDNQGIAVGAVTATSNSFGEAMNRKSSSQPPRSMSLLKGTAGANKKLRGKFENENGVAGCRIPMLNNNNNSTRPQTAIDSVQIQTHEDFLARGCQAQTPGNGNMQSTQNGFFQTSGAGGFGSNGNKFMERFEIKDTIGKGSYAVVKLARDTLTDNLVAIKMYDKYKLADPQKRSNVKREISILNKLNHVNVIKLILTVDTKVSMNLVMEYISNVSLRQFMKSMEGRRLEEQFARKIFSQLVSAVAYCHESDVVHRDIKLENIMVDTEDRDACAVKLIDFGFAIQQPSWKKLNIFCGTPTYMSPEITKKQDYFGKPADIWSLGVVLFSLLCGRFPFKGKDDVELFKKIQNGDYRVSSAVSQAGEKLIHKLLRQNPAERPTAKEVMYDPWFFN